MVAVSILYFMGSHFDSTGTFSSSLSVSVQNLPEILTRPQDTAENGFEFCPSHTNSMQIWWPKKLRSVYVYA